MFFEVLISSSSFLGGRDERVGERGGGAGIVGFVGWMSFVEADRERNVHWNFKRKTMEPKPAEYVW